jgi:Tol biopolymer transport system component
MISVQNAAAFLVASLSILMVNSVAAQTIEPRKLMGTINEESSWSPDGKTIAFDSIRSGKLNIYTWRIDTRELKRITTTEANDFTPEWSPDGKQIAFVSDRTGHNEIFAVDLNGGVPRQVTKDNSDAIHPHWSPDGQRIIYCSARDNPNQTNAPEGEVYEIYTIKPDGSDAKFDERSGIRWVAALVAGWKANRFRIEPRKQNRLRNLRHER